jgi:transposase
VCQGCRLWPVRYAESGIHGLRGIPHPGKPRVHDERVRSRILALSRTSPPQHTDLSHWSSREMTKYLKRHEGIEVSHVFVADLWREHGLKPHRQDTFKISRDPDFAEKVADIVGLYLSPPATAVVLCVDEKSGVPAAKASPSPPSQEPTPGCRRLPLDLLCLDAMKRRAGPRLP